MATYSNGQTFISLVFTGDFAQSALTLEHAHFALGWAQNGAHCLRRVAGDLAT
jgi:hypothetical protein